MAKKKKKNLVYIIITIIIISLLLLLISFTKQNIKIRYITKEHLRKLKFAVAIKMSLLCLFEQFGQKIRDYKEIIITTVILLLLLLIIIVLLNNILI